MNSLYKEQVMNDLRVREEVKKAKRYEEEKER